MKSLRDDIHIARYVHHIHTMRYLPREADLDARPFRGYTIVQVARLGRLKYRHVQQGDMIHSDVADQTWRMRRSHFLRDRHPISAPRRR